MSSHIIQNGATLRGFLKNLIEDSVNNVKRRRLVEQEQESEKLKKGDITAEEVIEKLNTIRSGKSFKDEEIMKAMESYVNDLNDAEKTALFAFLKGIAQIVTGEVEGTKATEPSDKPADVKMEKKPSSQKVSIKPNVIKKPASPKKKETVEDTTPPAPITPKKK
jgi:hypothetical protein